MSKTIFTGLESQGKSYMLGVVLIEIIYRNARWYQKQQKDFKELGPIGFQKKYANNKISVPTVRPIVVVLAVRDRLLEFARELEIPIIDWSNSRTVIADLEGLTSCDLVLDEVGTYFDSRTYKDLPLSTRLWLAQAAKLGVEIYGAAQDFSQIDISFRRLTDELYEVSKLIGSPRPDKTKPPVEKVWGILTVRQLEPRGYDEKNKYAGSKGWPTFYFLQKKYTEVFDTNKRVPKGEFPPFKHIVRRCEDPSCNFELYKSVHGIKHKITHA